jgi:hypothetical protein
LVASAALSFSELLYEFQASPNFVGRTVSLCDQSLIPSPLMAQVLTYHWLARGDYCGYKTVNKANMKNMMTETKYSSEMHIIKCRYNIVNVPKDDQTC